MGITYVIGDATEPLKNGEANCPCILIGETVCPGGQFHCYHFTGEGVCVLCNRTGKLPDPVPAEHLLYVNGVNRILENQRKAEDEPRRHPRTDPPGWVY